MPTQQECDNFQTALQTTEHPYLSVLKQISDFANADPMVSEPMAKAIEQSTRALRRHVKAHHKLLEAVCVSTGVTPLSGGQDKDED